MAEKYYSILTNRGKELEAASSATGTPVIISDFVIGDGNGMAVTRTRREQHWFVKYSAGLYRSLISPKSKATSG